MSEWMVLHGDLFDVLRTLPDESIDGCATDPPYGIGFMGKKWDTFTPGAEAERIVPNKDIESVNPNVKGRKRSPASSPSAVEYNRSLKGQWAFEEWTERWAREVYRVLKPGAYLLVCGAPRSGHRMTSGVEDAGFEIRDCLSWLYGSGFPKSLDVSKAIDKAAGAERDVVGTRPIAYPDIPSGYTSVSANSTARDGGIWSDPSGVVSHGRPVTAPSTDAAAKWDGWGTALKPGWEPIVLARKPLAGTVAHNVQTHGTGGLNIDACRIDGDKPHREMLDDTSERNNVVFSHTKSAGGEGTSSEGRWPANVVLDEEAAAMLDGQSGYLHAPGFVAPSTVPAGKYSEDRVAYGAGISDNRTPFDYKDGGGGASRFFYVAKPSREERDYGCDQLAGKLAPDTVGRDPDSAGARNARAGAGRGAGTPRLRCTKCQCDGGGGRFVTKCTAGEDHDFVEVSRGAAVRNSHPTVKPIALMRWLVRLIVPQGGTILDPFTGSGTTGMACRYEQINFIGIEREAEFVEIAEARISAVTPLFDESPRRKEAPVSTEYEPPLPFDSAEDLGF